MGMELNFVACSKDREKLHELKEYIHELYQRDYEDADYDHRMLGYGMQLEQAGNWYTLTGTHRKCFGYDLGYWANKEGKNSLFDGVLYLEEREEDSGVYLYYPDPSDVENRMLSNIECIMDLYDEDTLPKEKYNFPTELIASVRKGLRTGSIL